MIELSNVLRLFFQTSNLTILFDIHSSAKQLSIINQPHVASSNEETASCFELEYPDAKQFLMHEGISNEVFQMALSIRLNFGCETLTKTEKTSQSWLLRYWLLLAPKLQWKEFSLNAVWQRQGIVTEPIVNY
uniref:Uncharacterized protein n=1 Tax=Ditylenchus dipsaci TaxID=166011 RepID=A0A915EUQ3_9BILA